MKLVSKIGGFLTIAALAASLTSCDKNKNDVIPDVYVNFILDLNDPEFVNLTSLGGNALIDSRTNNWGQDAAGFDGNGIIIYRGVDEFLAYDRTCPHDYAVNGLSVKVIIDVSASLYAICPKCSTQYALPANGTPASGTGRYPLKNYRTRMDGRYVTVWNN